MEQLDMDFDAQPVEVVNPQEASHKGIHVEELSLEYQDKQIEDMTREFVDEMKEHTLHREWLDEDVLKLTCVKIRLDTSRDHVNCFIAYNKHRHPIGFLVGVTMPAFHRRGVVAEQKLWYVRKGFRGSRAAMKLLRVYEGWARSNGATQLYTGVVNERDLEKTSKLFTKLGYRGVGALFVKEV